MNKFFERLTYATLRRNRSRSGGSFGWLIKFFIVFSAIVTWRQACPLLASENRPPQPKETSAVISTNDPFTAKLSASSTAIVNGRPFREAIVELADRVKVPIWFDRRVDPSVLVDAGQVGPTVYAGIYQVAQVRDCVVMPVAGVLLVGRADWVDQTTTSLLLLRPQNEKRRIDVQWSDATTPNSILAASLSQTEDTLGKLAFPHDLWPSGALLQIEPLVASTLVAAQFDKRMGPISNSDEITDWETAQSSERVRVRYRFSANRTKVLGTIRRVDRTSQTEAVRNETDVIATASAQRAGVHEFLMSEAARKPASVNIDEPNLTFELKNTPAKEAFHHLAGAAGRRCRIEPSAIEACEKRIGFQAKEVSLKNLVQTIADQSGTAVTWTSDELIVYIK